MASVKESALLALFTALETVTGPDVKRNNLDINDIPANGLINLDDGEPGEPTSVTLSPPLYSYDHKAEVTCFVKKAKAEDRDSILDDLLQAIRSAITANETDYSLGGVVEYVDVRASVTDGLQAEGGEGIKGAMIPVILSYSTNYPV